MEEIKEYFNSNYIESNEKKVFYKPNEYRCAKCGGVFEKGVTEEECLKEMKEIWGDIPESERIVICDDCFNKRSPQEIKEMGKEYQSTPSDTFIEEKMKEFMDKFIGECPDYHDGITHESFPATWKQKMIDVVELKSFLKSSLQSQEKRVREEVEKEWGEKLLQRLEVIGNVTPDYKEQMKKEIKQLLK